MIIMVHLTYCSLKHIYLCFKKQFIQSNNESEENIKEYEVISGTAQIDAEFGLKFDPPVYCQRYCAVKEVLISPKWRGKIKKLVDFGCAELSFFMYLKNVVGLQEILFVDVDRDVMEYNVDRVNPYTADYLHRRKEPLNIKILEGSIADPDTSLLFVDAVICMEIIEHLYPDTLDAFPHNIFGFIQPTLVIFTTPNADFNVLFHNFSGMRHYDHKFEWTRKEFQDWCCNITFRYPQYSVYFEGVGAGPAGSEHLGCCSQMAVFIKSENYECDASRNDLIKTLNGKISSIPEEETCDKIDNLDSCAFCAANISDFMSHGVCTYKMDNVSNSAQCEHFNILYKMVREVNYPYEIDNRTQEEIIRDEVQFRIHRIGCYRPPSSDDDSIDIPLYELTSNKDGHFITEVDLRTILEKAGWKIEDRESNGKLVPYVIYNKFDEMSESSNESETSEGHFSTDVNLESEKDWHSDAKIDNTETWDEPYSNFDSSFHTTTKTDGTEIWDEATSNDLSAANTTKSELSEGGVYKSCAEEANSDPSTNGDVFYSPEEKLELLFDSGIQMSTSSINISPESSADNVADPDKSSLNMKPSASRNPKSEFDVNIQDVMKSESHIFNLRKRKCKLNEAQPNRIIPEIVLAPPPEIENPPVVENGDLANNNRDREGNNYQAPENVEQVDDNAVPRQQNLDEHNENHIVLENIEPDMDAIEDEDGIESLEDASREVLYDPNSEMALSDSAYDYLSADDSSSVGRLSAMLTDVDGERDRFPIWLLQMFQEQVIVIDDFEEDIGILGQGDGLGVHGSDVELIDVLERTSSSSSNASRASDVAQEASVLDGSVTVSAVSSSTDMQFQDALESLDETTNEEDEADVENVPINTAAPNREPQ